MASDKSPPRESSQRWRQPTAQKREVATSQGSVAALADAAPAGLVTKGAAITGAPIVAGAAGLDTALTGAATALPPALMALALTRFTMSVVLKMPL